MRAFLKAYNFIKTSIWKDDTSDFFVFQTAQKIYNKIKSRFTKNKVLIRISGQSGSGKTSQLFQANNYALRYSKIKPIHLAVRNFAKFYPKLNSNSKFSASFRETTNGFALKILIWILKFSLDDNLDIMLEISFLDKRFEKFIINETKKQNYKVLYEILSVNKLLSDIFILKRKKSKGRETASLSANYFEKNMNKTYKFIKKKNNSMCVMWSVFEKSPIYFGKMRHSYKSYKTAKSKISGYILPEKELLEFKKYYLVKLYQGVSV